MLGDPGAFFAQALLGIIICGGAYSPLRFDKVGRSYQAPALYANHKGANILIAPNIVSRLHFVP